ncbi:MAG: hypothetical protein IH616_08190 [Gemmatimonadales bacterium]|nr:hypothetical protein [Gemmatimonadales bacterium]
MACPGDPVAIADHDDGQAALEARAAFFHDALTDWLADPGITIVCGRWTDGAISEFMPAGTASLLPPAYEGRFAGIRELRIRQQRHHLHIDLGRIHALSYVVAPSVCLGFDPSLEIRLLTEDETGAPTDRWMVALMYANPYLQDRRVDPRAAERFFRSARDQLARRPDLVRVEIAPDIRDNVHAGALFECLAGVVGKRFEGIDWAGGLAALGVRAPAQPAVPAGEPRIVPLLREALALGEASLVIFRDRTLVEFKTDRLGGLHRYEEQGHVSWQIGEFDDHHCHLALGAVSRVLFSAEPVPCQGNRLNYTIWFLVPGACGNPYRPDGYFSITLNKPYRAGVARPEVIEPVMALYRRHAREAWVEADARFLEALADGPPNRRFDE